MFDSDDFLEQKIFSKLIQSLFYEEHFFSYNPFLNTSISLDEEKEKKDKQFSKSFKEIFSNNDNSFIGGDISDYFIHNKNMLDEDISFNSGKKQMITAITPRRKKGRLSKGSNRSFKKIKDKFDINNIIQKIIRHLVNVFCLI